MAKSRGSIPVATLRVGEAVALIAILFTMGWLLTLITLTVVVTLRYLIHKHPVRPVLVGQAVISYLLMPIAGFFATYSIGVRLFGVVPLGGLVFGIPLLMWYLFAATFAYKELAAFNPN